MGGSVSRRGLIALAAGAGATLLACCAGRTGTGGPGQASAPGREVSEQEQRSTTFFAFDTVVSITASCSQATLDALKARCAYFESIFSRTIATSDIGRINAAGGKPVRVAAETSDIVRKALAYCEESGGLFDITIGAVSSLWDFREGVVPADADVAEAVRHVGYDGVRVEDDVVTLADAKAKLDLGGIAKGYIADDICGMLADAGCESGFVNLGGNVKTVGTKPDGTPWHVGIQDPNDELGDVVAAVYSSGTSVVTSGLYERQFESQGRRYWHILDPRTGYPVQSDLMSATIVSTASLDGDGYTKPLFMMGHDEALAWLDGHDGIEGLVVDARGAITQSRGCGAEVF